METVHLLVPFIALESHSVDRCAQRTASTWQLLCHFL